MLAAFSRGKPETLSGNGRGLFSSDTPKIEVIGLNKSLTPNTQAVTTALKPSKTGLVEPQGPANSPNGIPQAEADRKALSDQIEEAKKSLNEIQEANKVLRTKIMNGESLKKRLNEVYQKMCKYDRMGEKERRKVLKVASSGNRDFFGPQGRLPAQLPDPGGQKLPVPVQKRLRLQHQPAEGGMTRTPRPGPPRKSST